MTDYETLKQERDELAAQNAILRDALSNYVGSSFADEALSTTPSAALGEIEARALDEAADNPPVNYPSSLWPHMELHDMAEAKRREST